MSRSALRVRRHTNPFSVPAVEPIQWTTLFAQPNPIEVEVGPAGGRFLLERARTAPQVNVLGLEIRTQMVERLAERIQKAQLANAAVLLANAHQAIPALFPPGTLSRFYAFHPDPWVKKRHLKRRLFTPSFVEAVATALAPGGELIAQSDVKELSEEILANCNECSQLENLALEGGFYPENATGIISETELYWLELGAPVYYLRFRKRG